MENLIAIIGATSFIALCSFNYFVFPDHFSGEVWLMALIVVFWQVVSTVWNQKRKR